MCDRQQGAQRRHRQGRFPEGEGRGQRSPSPCIFLSKQLISEWAFSPLTALLGVRREQGGRGHTGTCPTPRLFRGLFGGPLHAVLTPNLWLINNLLIYNTSLLPLCYHDNSGFVCIVAQHFLLLMFRIPKNKKNSNSEKIRKDRKTLFSVYKLELNLT